MSYHGDISEDAIIDLGYETSFAGAMTTIAGSPAVAVYKDDGTTEITAGVTLTVDFDGRTGSHNIRVDTSASASYTTGSNYSVRFTAGTVGGVSINGRVVGSFSIENRTVAGFASLVDVVDAISAWAMDPGGVRNAIGLASANLDTQLAAIDDFLDTEIAAIKAKTDLLVAFPTNFSLLVINGSGDISRVTLTDTLTTYTGNTPQTGDSFARIGATGSGLTSLAPASTALSNAVWTDAKAAFVDVAISSRLATAGYTAPDNTSITAIKVKTDNLPSDPADQSAVEAAITAATSGLASQASVNTIDDLLDTEVAAIKAKTDLLNADVATFATRGLTMLVLDGAVYQFTANALEFGPAGGGGGGGTDWTADERTAIRNVLGIPTSGTTLTMPTSGVLYAIKAKTDLITTANVTVTSPTSDDGETITLRRGDTYSAAAGNALEFTNAGWPVLTGGSALLKIAGQSFAGSVISASSIRVELTSAQTDNLPTGDFVHELEATLSGGAVRTLVTGTTTVIADL